MDGQIAVGWLVVEDVATVLILVLLPPLAGLLGSDAAPGITGKDIAIQIAITIGNVIAFIAVMMLCRIYINLYDRRRKEKERHDR